jgi:hypothetical protein
VKVRFLIDEDLSPDHVEQLRQYDLAIDVLRMGNSGAPALSTLDCDLLLYCERERSSPAISRRCDKRTVLEETDRCHEGTRGQVEKALAQF